MTKSTIAYQYLPRTSSKGRNRTVVTIERIDCLKAAQDILTKTGTEACVLNMANQFFVGGDYLSGKGQEESLILRTNLLDSLIELKGVQPGNVCNPYKYNLTDCLGLTTVKQKSGFGEFTCLYSEAITVASLDKEKLQKQFKINVISSAAYNLAYESNDNPDSTLYLIGTIFKIINQLRTAKKHGQRHLVLSAFGCGAFKNDPNLIADIYNSAINEYEFQGCFDTICFAIKPTYSNQEDSNLTAFTRAFKRPEKTIFDFLNSTISTKVLKENQQLKKMLDPFYQIRSENELCYLATQIINSELNLLSKNNFSNKSNKNTLKIKFLNRLLFLLTADPSRSQEIIIKQLLSTQSIVETTQTAGLFKGAKYPFIQKLENLLIRIPMKIIGLTQHQVIMADEFTHSFIFPKMDELLRSHSEKDKHIAIWMLYTAALNSTDEFQKEIFNRYLSDKYIPIRKLLNELNALCSVNTEGSKLDLETSDKQSKENTKIHLGRLYSQNICAYLQKSFPDFILKEEVQKLKERKSNPNPGSINSKQTSAAASCPR